MTVPLRVLVLEDTPEDFELECRELRRSGLPLEFRHVRTREEYLQALREGLPDLILSDFSMPGFDGLSAMKEARTVDPEIPFILVSGTVGEEVAIDALRDGATDYVLKQRLGRLVPAVRRVVQEIQARRSHRETAAVLHKTEARLQSILRASPVAMVVVDGSGRLTYHNPAMELLLARPAGDIQGRPLLDFVAPEDRATAEAEMDAFLSGHGPLLRSERRLLRPNGSLRWVRKTLAPLHEADGRRGGSFGMLEDVSETKLLEEQFLRAQKLESLGRLAGGIAHDFNNMLTAILGFTELAQMTLGPGGEVREHLDEVLKAGRRAQSLTQQLLAFSRRQTLQAAPLDLAGEILGVEKMLRRLIGEHIELRTELTTKPPLVMADRGQIEQVVMNLAVNARDAMPQGGRIALRVTEVHFASPVVFEQTTVPPGHYVQLSVADTGTGMDAAVRARIFEPFFTTKPKGQGTGLGLATVYGIVQQSKAHLAVESEPGQGSTFRIFFPVTSESVPPPAREAAHAPPVGPHRGTVLVVEDDESVLPMIRTMLARAGYTVLECSDGKRAIETARTHPGPIDLLLTDVGVPTVQGPEVAVAVRQAKPGVRVIFMSGHSSGAEEAVRRIPPGSPLIEKPFSREQLLKLVTEALGAAGR